jgi:cytochrome P450
VSSLVNLATGGFVKYKRKMHFKYSADRVDLRLARRTDHPDIMTLAFTQEEENKLNLGGMHSNAALLMVAGTETAATLLSGLVYHLLMRPDKMKNSQRKSEIPSNRRRILT